MTADAVMTRRRIVSVRLAAMHTDARVNVVVEDLLKITFLISMRWQTH